jgi:hypothetical protein
VEKRRVTACIRCKTCHQKYMTRFLYKVMLKNTIRFAGTKLSYWPINVNGHIVECSSSCWQVFKLKDTHTALLTEDYKRKNRVLIDDKARIVRNTKFNLVFSGKANGVFIIVNMSWWKRTGQHTFLVILLACQRIL